MCELSQDVCVISRTKKEAFTYMGIWQTIAFLNLRSTTTNKDEALLAIVKDEYVLRKR